MADIPTLARWIADERFDYPYLTGRLPPGRRFRSVWRGVDYAARIWVSERLGRCLFGARRHWFRVIALPASDRMIGMVLLDEVVREVPSGRADRGGWLLKGSSLREGARPGDGEIAMFMSPDWRRRGICLAALRRFLIALTRLPSGSSGRPILERIWAETSPENVAACSLLERLGLVRDPRLDRRAALSNRYSRDGERLALAHFRQPDVELGRLLAGAGAPVEGKG